MTTRREFLKSSAALTTAGVLMPGLLVSREAYAALPIPGVPYFISDGVATLLNPAAQPKFFTPVPNAASTAFAFQSIAPNVYHIGVAEFAHTTGLVAPDGTPLSTPVWGYQSYDAAGTVLQPATFPGRTIFALAADPNAPANTDITVTWINDLKIPDPANPALSTAVPHLLPVDYSIHVADVPGGYDVGGVPLVVHQHGGPTPYRDDGGPDQWFTPTLASATDVTLYEGPGCIPDASVVCNLPSVYPGVAEGGMVWYHDHALGITRLNVYAGTAGFWLTRDANELDPTVGLFVNNVIPQNYTPADNYEIALAFQDRQFRAPPLNSTVAELYFPSDPTLFYPPGIAGCPDPATLPNPSALPEFYGEIMLVNGVAWPKLDVEPRPYRVRLLNGSDSRFYNIRLISNAILQALVALTRTADRLRVRFPNLAAQLDAQIARSLNNAAQPFWQIGTELGFINNPVRLTSINLAPGERADVVVDFTRLRGRTLVWVNDGPTPYPFGAPTPITSGAAQLMAMNVNLPLNAAVPVPAPLTATTNLRPATGALPVPDPATAVATRQLILAEGMEDATCRLVPLLGTVLDGTMLYYDGPAISASLDQETTEMPVEETTEIWEFYNVSADSHPLHMHLVDFRILNREEFTIIGGVLPTKPHTNGVTGVGSLSGLIQLSGVVLPADPSEQGRKDTAQCPPGPPQLLPTDPLKGVVTRLLVHFPRLPRDANGKAEKARYVYHCHILSHEDNEMMRFYEVLPAPVPAV